jgi:RimJ/RimL family protein N-acetyltransferase
VQTHDLRLVRLPVEAMKALLAGDVRAASRFTGAPLTPYFVDEGWLWRIRLAQVARDPAAHAWIARAAVDRDGSVVGHVGFHGPPDERGMVEVAYAVDPALRRQGYGTALLAQALDWAERTPGVSVVRASVSPDNIGSLAVLRPFGFAQVGEQLDDEDGLELVYEVVLGPPG